MKISGKVEAALRLTRERSVWILSAVTIVHLIIVTCEFPFLLGWANYPPTSLSRYHHLGEVQPRNRQVVDMKAETYRKDTPRRSDHHRLSTPLISLDVSGLSFNFVDGNGEIPFSELHKTALAAWKTGEKQLRELQSRNLPATLEKFLKEEKNGTEEACPRSISLSRKEFQERGRLLLLPCGLTFGSQITIVAKPGKSREEDDGAAKKTVSQFIMELLGLKAVDGEDPPRILHFNPRLKGDWSGEPVIELNTCYRMQWGTPLRCTGRQTGENEETVDGLVKCEKWTHYYDDILENSKSTRWLGRLMGQTWDLTGLAYPFAEGRLFVLTLRAGAEGYHVHVDGKHITSFPYHPGFVLEDATGLALSGDIEVHSVDAAMLPSSHQSFSLHSRLELSDQWKAPPLTDEPVYLFIGIISAGNHFAERMAVRKTWMQSANTSRGVVARFFVAMHERIEINAQLKKEAEFFGDVVIVPFMDSYNLVVLKTIAICDYAVKRVSAKFIMKCDDDTFVRIDSVLAEINRFPSDKSLYLGNINYYHNPLRYGKWAVTFEEWSEETYPPYANGPGYVVSSDIGRFIVSEFERRTLRLFKMEDVSVGIWVEQFNKTRGVEYVHSQKYCQFGCVYNYFTAHYQSPRQMLCLWNKLRAGKPDCCSLG